MLMKDYFNRRKSNVAIKREQSEPVRFAERKQHGRSGKLLLFTLLTMLVVGASPAGAQKALPYSYGFEEASCSTSGWTKVNCHNSSENYKLGTSGAYKGDYAFRFYYTSNYPQYLISPELATSSYSLNVSFWYKAHSTSYEESFQVGYSTTDAETSSFTFGDEVKTKSTDWQEYTTTCPAGTKYICIACTSNDKYCLYIDDLVIDSDSPYKTPKAFASTGVTAATATFSWTAGGDETAWQIAYSSTEGFDADAATKVDVTTNPYTLEGLTAETTYYARIRADYGSGNYSAWSSEVSFKPTNAITTTVNDGSSTNSHVPFNGNYADTNGTMSQFIIPASTLTSLQGRMIQDMTFYTSTATKDFGNARFDVYMAETSATTFDAATFDWSDMDKVATSATVNIADGKMTITLDEGFNYSGDNLMIGFNLVATGGYTATSWYGIEVTNAAIKNYSGYSGGATIESFLPKITFTSLPGVPVAVKKPKNLAASAVATTTATLGWTDGEEGLKEWQIAYSTNVDFDPDTEGTKVAANANPYTLTELTASTTYYAYVRAKKDEDYSKWSNKVEFTTLAATPIMELSATTLSFGLVTDADVQAQTFTISNTGGVALSNLSVTCDNATFTITDGEGNALGTTIAAGATLTVKVKMNAVGQQSGTITISGDGVDTQTVTVSGYKADDTKIVETFASLPSRWTATGSWTYNATTGAYGTTYGGATLTSPKITVAEGETLAISAKTAYAGASYYVKIEGSADNGSTWTAFDAKTYSTASEPALSTTDFTVINITDIPTTVNRLRITAYYANINLFNGFTYAADPVLALYSDEACTTTVAAEVSKSFGFVTEEQSQNYYIKNTGTGQIDLSANTVDGFSVSIADAALTAGESTAVTITMPATEGTHNAAIVVTATNHDTGEVLGTFTVNASGALRDASKYYADGFTALPTGWSVDGSWSYSETNGAYTNAWYINQGTIARLKTPMLTLTAGETIAVEAKGLSTSNTSYQHLQLQYSADGTNWTALGDELTLDPSNWQTFMVAGPAEAGNYYIGILASQTCVRMFYGGEEASGANFAINTDGSTQDFGTVKANATAEKSFTVTNNGNVAMNVSFAATGDFTVTDPAASRKFNLTDNFGWGTGYAYAWDSEGNALLGAMPGTECGRTTNDYGETMFVVTVPSNAAGVIVNNGNGAQTVDITNFTKGYWMDGSKDDSGHYKVEGYDGGSEEAPAVLTVAAGESADFTVTMNTATPGSKSGNVTLSFEALNATSFTIPCTGFVKDPNALAVDFADGNFPENWQVGADWSVTSGSAVNSNTKTPSAIVTTPLTVAENETMTFRVARNLSGNASYTKSLKVRYSQDGGVTWSAYQDYGDEFGSSFADYQLTGVPAGTVIVEFLGNNIKLDDIEGFTKTTGPVLVLTESGAAVANGATKDFGNITADATATYTLKNAGNKTLDATLAGEGVTVSPATVNLAAGETAEITVTMAYAEPYGEKTGKMTITSESWVGDMTVNFTADAIDASGFVVDFEDNALPAGWYNGGWTIANGVAYVYAGTNKQLISEKIGAEEGKNVLRFDAKAYTGSDSQTLSVSTSTDRKTWSDAQTFTLTGESQTFSLAALADGEYYVKFEAANATVDNIKGVKKLTAPATDLYLVSSSMPTENVTPGSSYTATVNVASLIAAETVKAELYFGDSKIAETEQQVGTTSTAVTLTGTAPAAGTYNVYAKVYVGETSVQTEPVQVVVADTRIMAITAFTRTSDANVQADENNEFTATLDVTVQNNGTASLAANEVSVTLTDGTNAYENGTFTWTAENSDVLYMNTSNGTDDIANDCTLKAWCWNTEDDGVWTEFSKVNDGFYSLALNGKTNVIVCRVNPAGTDEDPWNNVYNKSDDLSLANGNLVKFSSYSDNTMNFSQESMGYLEPTMSTTLKLTLKLSAGEGGSFTFNAKENVSNTQYFMSQSVSVTPFAIVALNETETYAATTESYGKVTLNRPFIAGWNTLVLPFDIDAATFASKFGADAALYVFTSNTEGELQFTKTTEGVKAGTPYLLYLSAAITGDMTFTGVTVQPGTTLYQHDANSNGAEFKGNYVYEFNMEGKYGVTPAGTVQKGGEGSWMKAYRAYITMPEGQNARIAIFDETTGISRVLTAKEVEDMNIFNLQGQRVGENAKGVVIKGGKKVVVK